MEYEQIGFVKEHCDWQCAAKEILKLYEHTAETQGRILTLRRGFALFFGLGI